MYQLRRHAVHPVAAPAAFVEPACSLKIISWNLLRLTGATRGDVAALIRAERPDLLLMQEATADIDGLPHEVGGFYNRAPLPGRIHGPAIWSALPHPPPRVVPLPAGALINRVALVLDAGAFSVANVHLSHGQVLNRRQLRRLAMSLPAHAAVLGDFNLVGPALLPGFRDVGPRQPTHVMGNIMPIRLDRCLVRGLSCAETAVLPRERSDHCPIVVRLTLAAGLRQAA